MTTVDLRLEQDLGADTQGWPLTGLWPVIDPGKVELYVPSRGEVALASDVALPSPDPSTLPAAAWRQLSSSMIGPLLHPGHAQFEPLHRPATNRHPAAHPRAIARCATPADVAHAIAFARCHGLEDRKSVV